MKRLFLTSSVGTPGVAKSIRGKIAQAGDMKTVFITTPVETDAEKADLSWLEEDRSALNQAGFTTFDYTITGKSLDQIENDLKDIEVLYISGGNEFYFREICTEVDFDSFVHKFVDSGKPYIGTSCGSIIAGTDMSPTMQLNDLEVLKRPVETHGFGLVNFTVLPHWGSTEFHDRYLSAETFQTFYKPSHQLVALNNFEYVEVEGEKWHIVDIRSSQ